MDFYILLGLERGATLSDIKRAYKRLARRYHPDINPGDRVAAAQFRRIAEAYETLSDPDRRHRYDVHGPAAAAADPATFGFEGFDFSVSVEGADAPTFGDLFAEVFQQRTTALRPERGADLHDTIDLAFDEALAGGPRSVTITRQVHCQTCRGLGRLAVAETRCTYCQGSGVVKSARGHMPVFNDGATPVVDTLSDVDEYSNSKPTTSRPKPMAKPRARRLSGVVFVPMKPVMSARAGAAAIRVARTAIASARRTIANPFLAES